MIMGSKFHLTLRALESACLFMGQSHCDLHFGHFEIHLPDALGSSQAEQLSVTFFALYSLRVSSPPGFFTLSTQKSEAPFLFLFATVVVLSYQDFRENYTGMSSINNCSVGSWLRYLKSLEVIPKPSSM
jgi:hypothetical protein